MAMLSRNRPSLGRASLVCALAVAVACSGSVSDTSGLFQSDGGGGKDGAPRVDGRAPARDSSAHDSTANDASGRDGMVSHGDGSARDAVVPADDATNGDAHSSDAGHDAATKKDAGDAGKPHDDASTCGGGAMACTNAASCHANTNPCEVATCTDGCCAFGNVAADTACTSGATKGVCNGAGQCVGCLTPANCPAPGVCEVTTCSAGACGTASAPSDTACSGGVCNGSGHCVGCLTAANCPAAPVCQTASCGILDNCGTTPVSRGTACTSGTGTVCNGLGSCVECNAASDCPNAPACETATCSNQTCGTTPTATGTPCPAEPGTCNGKGQCSQVSCTSAAGCPATGSACVIATCVGSICSANDAPLGTTCTDSGGRVCNASGKCVACNTAMDCPTGIGPPICLGGTCL